MALMDPRKGWHKDPFDFRDYLHVRRIVALPAASNNRGLLVPAWDQLNEGSCVAHGINLNLVAVMKILGIFTERVSPRWTYNGARALDGTIGMDVGTTPGSALSWLLKHGLLLEVDWPYVAGVDTFVMPSSERMAKATMYLDFKYFRVDNGVDGIRSALADRHFVSIGAPWFDKWDNPGLDGILSPVVYGDSIGGGHETCYHDYDDSANYFFGQNSWGPAWGKEGRYLMPYSSLDTFKQCGGYDAHYITMTATIIPTPAPGPTPPPSCAVGNAVAAAMNFLPKVFNRPGRFSYTYPRRKK